MGTQYIAANVQNPYSGGFNTGSDPCDESNDGNDLPTFNGVIYPPQPCDNTNGLVSQKSYFKKIVVFDFLGHRTIELENIDSFDTNGLSKGIYIIKAQLSNGKIVTKKIFV